MTQVEIENKVKELKEYFRNALITKPTIYDLYMLFKESYNDLFVTGQKIYIDLDIFMTAGRESKEFKKRFDHTPLQPATITYSRGDVMFFTWDNYPKYEEEWICKNPKNMNAWVKNIYLANFKYSDLFKKKIEKLKETDPDELAIQIGVFTPDTLDGKIVVEKDI